MSKQVESAAYHEAGHVAAAVLQGMPIRPTGVHVDLYGNGCADYFERLAGDLGLTELDEVERKRTIIALYAGHCAQLSFYPECEQRGWGNDLAKIRKLVREMYPIENQAELAQQELRSRAKRLVVDHWQIVEDLAKTLLSKEIVPMSAKDTDWGTGPSKRNMAGAEIAEFFAKHHLSAKIVTDDVRNYNSTQDVPPYDSLG